jgi:hypothetical protein
MHGCRKGINPAKLEFSTNLHKQIWDDWQTKRRKKPIKVGIIDLK